MADGATLRRQAHSTLSRYFAAECGSRLSLPNTVEITRQRQAFTAAFGPARLAQFSATELLHVLPFNQANAQPLDYWLASRRDEFFDNRWFGGGSGLVPHYGVWQDKTSGCWRTPKPGGRGSATISATAAAALLDQRRQEMLAAAAILAPLQEISPAAIAAEALQQAIAQAAPRWHKSAWLHQYLHLLFPDRVTCYATLPAAQAQLYRLGVPAASELYACDIRLLQFWSELAAPDSLPLEARYRLGDVLTARAHWALCSGADTAAWGRDYLALGPDRLGSLAGLFTLTRRREIRAGLRAALVNAGLTPAAGAVRTLLHLGCDCRPGGLVAVLSDPATVLALGEISGPYRYAAGAERPHRLPVRWLRQNDFTLSTPVTCAGELLWLAPVQTAVAELEAALLATGVGPWPDFARYAAPPTAVAASEPIAGVAGRMAGLLERKNQLILYGPPGVGKTYHAERAALEIIARANFRCRPEQLGEQQQAQIHGDTGMFPYLVFCTFHPTYGYEDFIEGYRPDGAGFRLQAGLFKRLVAAASMQPDKRFVLIIDEINRGNAPRIFGELLTLLDRRDRARVVLPLSGDAFTVPGNIYLIGTMNAADRSIALLDTALRRRFAFLELPPEPGLLHSAKIGEITLADWLRALNRRIREQFGPDGRQLQLGHGYFMPDGVPVTALPRIGAIIRSEIWPLLQEYCYDDPARLAAILEAEGGLYDSTAADLRAELFEPGRESALVAALSRMVTPADRADAGDPTPAAQTPAGIDS